MIFISKKDAVVSVTRIFLYKDRIVDSVFIWEKTDHRNNCLLVLAINIKSFSFSKVCFLLVTYTCFFKPLILFFFFMPQFQIAHNLLINSKLVSRCLILNSFMHWWSHLSHTCLRGPKQETSRGCNTSATCGGNLTIMIFSSSALLMTGINIWVRQTLIQAVFQVSDHFWAR